MRRAQLLAGVFAGALFATGAWAADGGDTSNVGRINVQGVGAEAVATPGVGLLIPEETPKAKSTVTRAYIEGQRPTSNPFQMMMLLPGVNTGQDDAYGLSGGKLNVRGFDSSQMGFTIEGVPLNDSGNYAVYPQEFLDIENLDEVFVTQGAVDLNAPHVGASGGNLGMVLRSPSDERGGYFAQSLGQFGMNREFLRLESGLLSSGTKFYLSGSNSFAEKFRGAGYDSRQHSDFKIEQKVNDQSDITGSVLFNNAENYSYRAISKGDWRTYGRKYDWDTNYYANDTNFYQLKRNPFQNVIAETTAHMQATDNLRFTVEPYLWYGYGNGGGGTVFKESSPPANNNAWGGEFATGTSKAIDLNGNGSTKDSILYYTPSITETYRPGIQTQADYQLNNHMLSTGLWYEHARHIQTGPASTVSSTGVPSNIWGDTNLLIDPSTGNPVEYRNWVTTNDAKQVFFQDNAQWFSDKVKTTVGVRVPWLSRSGLNKELGVTPSSVNQEKTYSDVLPTIAANYEFYPSHSTYVDFTKNFRAPQNYPLYDNPPQTSLQKAETSYNYDLGYRFQTDRYIVQASLFWVDFYNRIATAVDPNTNVSTDTNVGATRTKGAELQSGMKVTDEWSLFGSFTYNNSVMRNNFPAAYVNGQTIYLPTKGKAYYDIPEYMGALSAQWAHRGFFAGGQLKYTGLRYATLMNDETVAPLATVDLNAGYHLTEATGEIPHLKDPTIRINVTNLFDKNYLSYVSSYKNNATTYGSGATAVAGASPTYQVGAPRTISVTLSTGF